MTRVFIHSTWNGENSEGNRVNQYLPEPAIPSSAELEIKQWAIKEARPDKRFCFSSKYKQWGEVPSAPCCGTGRPLIAPCTSSAVAIRKPKHRDTKHA